MKISVQQVVEAAECRRAAVTAEAAGFIVLQAVRAHQGSPAAFSRRKILLSSEGEISVLPASDGVTDAEGVEAELLQLLVELLKLTRAVPPALTVLAGRPPRGELDELEGELLAALIPFNPAAARRGLARLYREVCRAQASTKGRAGDIGRAAPSETSVSAASPAPAAESPPAPVAETRRATSESPFAVLRAETAGDLPIEIDYEARRVSSLPPAVTETMSEPTVPQTVGGVSVDQAGDLRFAPPPPSRAAVRVTLPMPDPEMRGTTPAAEPVQLNLFAEEEVADGVDELLAPTPAASHLGSPFLVSAQAVSARLTPDAAEATDTTPCTAPPIRPVGAEKERRSNLEDLMKEFLAHTRSERVLSANLRSLVGVEVVPAKNAS